MRVATISHVAPLSHLAVSCVAPAHMLAGRWRGFKVATKILQAYFPLQSKQSLNRAADARGSGG